MKLNSVPVLFVATAACFGQAKKEESAPEVTLHEVATLSYQGSKVSARSFAERVEYQRNGDFRASRVRVLLPTVDGGPGLEDEPSARMELKAPWARGNVSSRQVDGFGGVTVRAASGLTGHTERAHVDGLLRTAHGNDPVRLDGPTYWMTAQGFSLGLDNEEFDFSGPVESSVGGKGD